MTIDSRSHQNAKPELKITDVKAEDVAAKT